MIIGLAPAAHGGTRTGRAFTGDKSGDFLFKSLKAKILIISHFGRPNGKKEKSLSLKPVVPLIEKLLENEIYFLDDDIKKIKSNKISARFRSNNIVILENIRFYPEEENNENSFSIMKENNPIYIPRNHLVESALKSAINGNKEEFDKLIDMMSNTYNYNVKYDKLQTVPKDFDQSYKTFCGT